MTFWRPRLSIRRLAPEDAAAWRDLRLEALERHPEAYGATHDDWAGRPLQDFADRLARGPIFGAWKNGVLIGSLALDPAQDDPSIGQITAVYTQAEFRRKGVARRLLRRAKEVARGQGMRMLSLSVAEENQPAFFFYQANGFSETGRDGRELTRDGRFLNLISMSCRL